MVGQIVSSICQIHNITGGTLTFKEAHDYNGHNSPIPYPNEIPSGYWAMFVHSGDSDTPFQSVGAVVYCCTNADGDQCEWMMSWMNIAGEIPRKVYTEIYESGHYDNPAVWPEIHDRLTESNDHSEAEWKNWKASVGEMPYNARDVFPIFQGEIQTK